MMRSSLLCATACLVVIGLTPSTVMAEPYEDVGNPFPEPAGLEHDIRFWTRVYTEVGTDAGLLHDARDLSIVYEVVDLPSGVSRSVRERHVESRKDRYRAMLEKFARGSRAGLSTEEARVLALFPPNATSQSFRVAAQNLRFQLGQADKFRAGLIRSGAYQAHVEATLDDMGLPRKIAALPHVESSHTPHAYSRVGAAGLWQFTRSTGRRFMRVDHVVDERLDPYMATVAAARLLEQNRIVTGSWPLAITAYNHGAAGMRRAVRKVGTTDIERIVREYRSRTFGFASRNFYVEFLAAARIAEAPDLYFGHLVRDNPIDYERIELPFYGSADAVARAIGVPISTLQAANPALRPSVWQGQKRIPRGFELKVPRAELARPLSIALADVPSEGQYSAQTRDTYHVVRRGDTLSSIASRYGVRMSELQAINGLHSRHHIRAGQKLRLPGDHVAPTRIASVRPEPIEPIGPPADGRYTVQRGDTIAGIARRFGMTESDLVDANALRNRNRIYPGQVLRVATGPDPSLDIGPTPAATGAGTTVVDGVSAAPDSHPHALAELTPSHADEPLPGLDPAGDEAPDEDAPAEDALLVSVAAEAGDVVSTEAEPREPVELLADPSDYSVATDGTIEVQAMETLGHYAEWLGIRASRLRAINDLSYGENLPAHSRIKLDFSQVDPADFERQRHDYHRTLQEAFFTEWEISGTETHRLRRGDTLWVLSHRRFNVPIWLLQQYNPDVDFEAPAAGTDITVPLLKRREWLDGAQNASRPPRTPLG